MFGADVPVQPLDEPRHVEALRRHRLGLSPCGARTSAWRNAALV